MQEYTKVLSFQSKIVLDTLSSTGSYYADASIRRERRNYSKDIEQLNGHAPIWCFAPVREEFTTRDFLSGELFERFRCEMSLQQGGLKDFELIELCVPTKELKLGLTHNAYLGAKVLPYLTRDMLQAHYRLSAGPRWPNWYFIKVNLITQYNDNILFPNGMQCSQDDKDPEPEELKVRDILNDLSDQTILSTYSQEQLCQLYADYMGFEPEITIASETMLSDMRTRKMIIESDLSRASKMTMF